MKLHRRLKASTPRVEDRHHDLETATAEPNQAEDADALNYKAAPPLAAGEFKFKPAKSKPVQPPRTPVVNARDGGHGASVGGGGVNADGGGGHQGDSAGNGGGGAAQSGAGQGDQVYDTVEHPPVPITKVLPLYPGAARAQGLEGEVVLRAIVDQHGVVEPNVVVVESVPMLDRAAIDALRQWRFQPGRDGDDRAVRALIEVPLRFRLR
jgi:protein TonB